MNNQVVISGFYSGSVADILQFMVHHSEIKKQIQEKFPNYKKKMEKVKAWELMERGDTWKYTIQREKGSFFGMLKDLKRENNQGGDDLFIKDEIIDEIDNLVLTSNNHELKNDWKETKGSFLIFEGIAAALALKTVDSGDDITVRRFIQLPRLVTKQIHPQTNRDISSLIQFLNCRSFEFDRRNGKNIENLKQFCLIDVLFD